MKKILFAASECVPFVKTGGLADVAGALPKQIMQVADADVRVIIPLYKAIDKKWRDQMELVTHFNINLGWRTQYVGVMKTVYDGVTFYFIDNEQYFGREYIYGSTHEEGERYAFFDRAVLEVLPKIDFFPDVLHCHDWQTGMIPVLLEAQYRKLDAYKNIHTCYTIHNLQYQGVFPISNIEDFLAIGNWAYTSDKLEYFGMCSFMKGGIVFSDEVSTVSPTYAKEIQTAYYGEGLDGLLRSRLNHLTGILNGIDTKDYDPETDEKIAVNYNVDTFIRKVENKTALQQELGMTINPNAPMIGMVGRLNGQKGLDLVECVLNEIMNTGAQLVILGMGDSKYVDLFSWAQWKYAGQVAACFQMNHALAHKIYASCDMFLMPSMFEPCGLSQLIALRYGTLPITRETGGLRDTVLSYNEYTGDGNGFTFLNYNAHDMLHVIESAVNMYNNNRETFDTIAKRAMTGSYGWDVSAKKYVEMYDKICGTETAVTADAPAAVVEEEAKPVKKRAPRKKKSEETTAEAATEAPKKRTTRKKKTEEAAVEATAEAEAPKKRTTRKKKTEEAAVEATAEAEAPKKRTTRKKKVEETAPEAPATEAPKAE